MLRREEHQNKRILVVDDEDLIRQIVEAMLRSDGYDVALADCGEVALELVQNNRFDAALLDVNLPGIDGITLHRRIWNCDRRLARKCLFMSGQGQSETLTVYVTSRGAGFIDKPFDAADLQAALRRTLNGGSS